jgi:hypothetical protein
LSTAGYPELIVIGAQKCATTSLWRYLDVHPEISMASAKETNFFLWHHDRGPGFYEGLFDSAARVRGESCPDYSVRPFSDEVAGRIARAVPEARLIYLVRDPVERVVSHWMHAASLGRDPLPFAESVASEEFPVSEYVLRSRYWWQLEPFLERFPDERVRVVIQEDLAADPVATMRRLYEYAGVDPNAASADQIGTRFHASEEKRRPPRLARALLMPGAHMNALPPSPRRARLLAAITRRAGRPIARPVPRPADRARIAALVDEDVAALSDHLGRPLWGFGD